VHAEGTGTLRLYRKPGANGTLRLIYRERPLEIAQDQPLLAAPACVREYFVFRMLAAARAKESDGAMPEVAQAFGGLADVVEAAMREYWSE
jgi:hypothetical protein